DVELAHIISGRQTQLPTIGVDVAAKRVAELQVDVAVAGEGTELEAVAEAIVDTQDRGPVVAVIADEVAGAVQILPVVRAKDPEASALLRVDAGVHATNVDRAIGLIGNEHVVRERVVPQRVNIERIF